MKKFSLILFIYLPLLNFAQNERKVDQVENFSRFNFQINTGLYIKIRGQVEFNLNPKNSITLSLSKHYGPLNPGAQAYVQYKRFYPKSELFSNLFYGKIGYGKSFTYNGEFGIFGFGTGQKLNLGKKKIVFIQFTEGIKMCPIIRGDVESEVGSGFRGLFYLTGPGSVIDLNINFGIKL